MSQEDVGGAVLEWLRAHERDMLALLERVVNIDSGSYHKAGVDRVGTVFREFLDSAGVATTVFPIEEYGDCLLGEVPGSAGSEAPHVLLLGHMDTVFPEGTVAQRPYRVENGIAYGPGVADMKAGLVMNAFVARAFAELGGNQAPIRVFFTGDEEIASPASRPFTLEMAKGAAAVLNAEPGRPSGNVVVKRKGAFFIDFEVAGIPAHAGVAHEKGASAIEALARKVSGLHALTDRQSGVTTNVGTVQGGVSINTVAPYARGQLDVRFPKEVDEQSLRRKIIEIIEDQAPDNTRGTVVREGNFLPLFETDASRKLFADYRQAGVSLGLEIDGEATGGSADSGLTSAAGAPTLCATGAVGGEIHTPEEYCRIDTLVPRAQIAALTILAHNTL